MAEALSHEGVKETVTETQPPVDVSLSEEVGKLQSELERLKETVTILYERDKSSGLDNNALANVNTLLLDTVEENISVVETVNRKLNRQRNLLLQQSEIINKQPSKRKHPDSTDTFSAVGHNVLSEESTPLPAKRQTEMGTFAVASSSFDEKDILFREAISNWRREADNEKEDARRNGFNDLRGTHTVICLDTSGSMEHGDAWKQAEKFYKDFLNGMIDLKKEGIDHENVALVTFSGEVLVQERLTKDFEKLLEKFDTLKPSGPTQMFGGLLFAEAVALTSKFSFALVNNVHIRTKIIIITDGMPTEIVPVCTHDDINDPEKIDETKKQIIKEVERIQNEQVDIHCVYVGESDSCEKEFLRLISTASVNEGLLSATDGEKMARHTVYKCLAENSSYKGGLFKDLTPDFLTFMKKRLSERDLSSLLDLPDLSKLEEKLKSCRDFYKECDDKRYPEIGKRARRGRDWKWGNQDSSGVGTIIGHGMEEETQLWVWVEWDADGEQNIYRWQSGSSKKSDLMFVDEERILKQGEILAVGTKVRKAESEENAEAMTGIVIKITKDEKKALVRWEDKTRDEYFFGKEDTQKEIVVIVRKESGDIGNRASGSQDSGSHAGASLPPEGPVEVTDILKDSAVLIWKKPTHEGSTNLTSYQIEWRVKGKEWPVTMDRTDAGPATLSYRLTHLRGNTEYEADIKAVNDTGHSAPLKCKIRTKHQLELSLPSVQHKVLTSRYLARIVDAIGFNWELLAAELEINVANIQQVRMNNCTSQVRILDILTTWHQREGPDATFGELIKRMRNVKSVTIDWPIIEEIANCIDKESKK